MWWARLLNVIAGLLNGAGAPASTTSYESIATANGTGSSGTISFTSIPSTYKHLQLRIYGGVATTATSSSNIRFNNDTTDANYACHFLYGNGASATAGGGTSTPYGIYVNGISSAPSATIIDILDYTNTSKNKTTRVLNGYDANGSGVVNLLSNLWLNTAAINRVDIVASQNWGTYSSFALYGIKG
jgi:hypothetical protein